MSGAWDGKERRSNNRDHDTLIEMVQILKNHVSNFDTLNREFRDHQIKDEANFKELERSGLKTQKAVWMAAGALCMVQLIPAVMKVVHGLSK